VVHTAVVLPSKKGAYGGGNRNNDINVRPRLSLAAPGFIPVKSDSVFHMFLLLKYSLFNFSDTLLFQDEVLKIVIKFPVYILYTNMERITSFYNITKARHAL